MTDSKPKTFADVVLAGLKLEWVRPLIYNLGGRKLALGAGGLTILTVLSSDGVVSWPEAVLAAAVAVIVVGSGWAIAREDSAQ